MYQSWARLLVLVLSLIGILVPQMPNMIHPCEALFEAENSAHYDFHFQRLESSSSPQKDSVASHSEDEHQDCHCPLHISGCCSSHVYLGRHLSFSFLNREPFNYFIVFSQVLKPGPSLDGPFQPPRA